MSMDFPSPASEGQFYTPLNGPQYVYVNGAWRMAGAPTAVVTAETRSRIVNGAMQISQENGNTVGTTNAYYAADQWPTNTSIAVSAIVRDIFQTTLSSSKAVSIAVSVAKPSPAAGDFLHTYQAIEGIKVIDFGWGTAAAKQAVLRFTAYSSIAGTYSVSVRNSVNDRSFLAPFTLPAGAWTTVSIVIPGDTTGTWLKDTGIGIAISIALVTGTTYGGGVAGWQAGYKLQIAGNTNWAATAPAYFYYGDVGLYLDPLATGIAPPWQMPDEAEELRACQRYFEKIAPGAGLAPIGAGSTTSTVVFRGVVPYALKRAVPAITNSAVGTFSIVTTTGIAPSAINWAEIGLLAAHANCTIAGGTAGFAGTFRDATGTAAINVSARM